MAQKSVYCENIEEELDKIAIDKNYQDIEEILNKFYELNEKLKEKALSQKADEIFKCIPMKMEKFYDRFDKECMNIPIFKYQEPRLVFQRLMYASNEDLIIIKDRLIKRANMYVTDIIQEKDNLEELKKIIDEYIKDKNISIKTVMLEEFSKGLKQILEIYENKLTKEEK